MLLRPRPHTTSIFLEDGLFCTIIGMRRKAVTEACDRNMASFFSQIIII